MAHKSSLEPQRIRKLCLAMVLITTIPATPYAELGIESDAWQSVYVSEVLTLANAHSGRADAISQPDE